MNAGSARDQAQQSQPRITYAEHAFTAPIDTTAAYRASLPAEAETL